MSTVIYFGKRNSIVTEQRIIDRGSIIFEEDTKALKISDGRSKIKDLGYLPFSLVREADIKNWNETYKKVFNNNSVSTETDPTVPNHVKNISTSDVANWNNAYSWGNHASEGYLINESDPTVPNHVKAISALDISGWNTAVSWGNHASAGYLTNESDPTVGIHIKNITSININNWNNAYSAAHIHGNITALNNVSGVNTGDQDLSGLVVKNAPITGATKTKVTYDAKGLVTSGTDATTADISDSTNKRYVTDANLITIGNQSGTNSGDETRASIISKLTINPVPAYTETTAQWHLDTNGSLSVLSAAIFNLNTLRFYKFVVPKTRTGVARLGIEITAAGTASSKGRVGIYTCNTTTNKPDVLIVDSGTTTEFAMDSTGGKSVFLSATFNLPPGEYFYVFVHNSAANVTMRNIPYASTYPLYAVGPGGSTSNYYNTYTAPFTYAALPSNCNALTLTPVSGQSAIAIWYYL